MSKEEAVQPLDPQTLTNAIIWFISAGHTGETAAELIRDQIPNGREYLSIAAEDTPEAIMQRIESDPASARIAARHKDKLKSFLFYFIGRAKELTATETKTHDRIM